MGGLPVKFAPAVEAPPPPPPPRVPVEALRELPPALPCPGVPGPPLARYPPAPPPEPPVPPVPPAPVPAPGTVANDEIEMLKKFIEEADKTLFKTSINRINLKGGKNLPHYEIYIAADLLAGDGNKIIDESNVNEIKCAYNDYNATKNFKKYNQNPYFVEQGPLIELPKKNDKDLAKDAEKDLVKNPPKIGGKTKRKRNKNKKRPRKQTRRIKHGGLNSSAV